MNINDTPGLRDTLIREIMATGAVAVGITEAAEISPEAIRQYDRWIGEGRHAGMDYLPRHALLKRHPCSVLEDVASVVSIAYSYAPAEWRNPSLPHIAAYAYGDDYHDVLRQKLRPVIEKMGETYGGNWRICIDSAPVAERYWAVKSGIARIGINGCVIIDGHGSFVFLVEILTSHHLPPTIVDACNAQNQNIQKRPPSLRDNMEKNGINTCMGCGECVKACPTGALKGDGTIDCRRCLNYLTIEHRGDWTDEGWEAMQTDAGHHTLYGCDICQRVCPHNRSVPPTTISQFSPRPDIITKESLSALTQADFSRIFKGSPIKRTRLSGLLRNASNLTS